MSLISRLNSANTGRLVAGGAILLALGAGTATAGPGLITGKGIKDSSITGVDIKNGSLSEKELSSKARKALAGKTGPAGAAGAVGAKGDQGTKGDQGAQGVEGPQGIQGIQGERGPSNAEGQYIAGAAAVLTEAEVITGTLEPGNYLMSGKITLTSINGEVGKPSCALYVMRGEFVESLDVIDGVTLTETTDSGNAAAYSFTAVTNVDVAATEYGIRCEADLPQIIEATDRSLTATQVATINS